MTRKGKSTKEIIAALASLAMTGGLVHPLDTQRMADTDSTLERILQIGRLSLPLPSRI